MRRCLLAVLFVLIVQQTEPIVGPGPCNSDTPWGCYAYRLFLPGVMHG